MTLAHKKIAAAAMLKRKPAVVKTPSPERLILMATALAPNRMHMKADKMAAEKVSSPFVDIF